MSLKVIGKQIANDLKEYVEMTKKYEQLQENIDRVKRNPGNYMQQPDGQEFVHQRLFYNSEKLENMYNALTKKHEEIMKKKKDLQNQRINQRNTALKNRENMNARNLHPNLQWDANDNEPNVNMQGGYRRKSRRNRKAKRSTRKRKNN
jgi:hypothetical protein